MIEINDIKSFLKEDADTVALEAKLKELTALKGDDVKQWINLPENKSLFDSIVGKAITSHIEKAKVERTSWEATRSKELLQEARDSIAKEDQKTPVEIELENIKAELAKEKREKQTASLKSNLLDLVKKDGLSIAGVDPFIGYGDEAESKLRSFADVNKQLIDDGIKAGLAEKFGKADMNGNTTTTDDKKEIGSAEYYDSLGFDTK